MTSPWATSASLTTTAPVSPTVLGNRVEMFLRRQDPLNVTTPDAVTVQASDLLTAVRFQLDEQRVGEDWPTDLAAQFADLVHAGHAVTIRYDYVEAPEQSAHELVNPADSTVEATLAFPPGPHAPGTRLRLSLTRPLLSPAVDGRLYADPDSRIQIEVVVAVRAFTLETSLSATDDPWSNVTCTWWHRVHGTWTLLADVTGTLRRSDPGPVRAALADMDLWAASAHAAALLGQVEQVPEFTDVSFAHLPDINHVVTDPLPPRVAVHRWWVTRVAAWAVLAAGAGVAARLLLA